MVHNEARDFHHLARISGRVESPLVPQLPPHQGQGIREGGLQRAVPDRGRRDELDALLPWVLPGFVALVVLGLVVALIVIQTVAGILTGGRPSEATVPSAPLVAQGTIAFPVLPEAPLVGEPGGQVVQLAQTWLGVPCSFGGCTHAGVDCSCLVQNVYAQVGIRLPRIAVDQFNVTVSVSDPQPSDLVFFANGYQPGISHVGIYIGSGLQINAPTTGQLVSVASVFTGYWGAHYAGARRIRV